MEFLYLGVGIVIGFVVAYLLLVGQKKGVEADLMLARQQTDTETQAKADTLRKLDAASDDLREMQSELVTTKMSLSSMQAQLEAERKQHDEEAQQRKEQQAKWEEQRQQQFDAQLETVKEQFQNLASQVLDQSADKLKTQNTESMAVLTAPLKENITKLHDAIFNTNQETAKNTASLSEQLKAMAEQTQKIDMTATRLTNVMRGGNKIQGNWGELILTEILEQNGFREGINYDVQQTLTDDKGNILTNDESGRKMIPDVILHYPKNEDVVIDSKMSIESYELWVNTDNDTLKKKYAEDLVKSLRTQFTNLSKKDYSSYVKPPRHAIDFVIMFVPNEGALQLALATDKRLWSDAFDKRVFITSQQNLMAILKMIEIAWRQYTQTENQLKVYGLAEEMLKRVGEFIKRFDKVKKDIDMLSKDYDEAYNKAYTGRQSIVQKANELKQLGVKESANQPIPAVEEEILPLE
ncbi:MAG: DNA recombination protein RmuC [Prevotella sp.]|nr:DNA recombination protein RmuC [Prevotella sp.]